MSETARQRAASARALIAERFLAATEAPGPDQIDFIAFPASFSTRSIRVDDSGGITVTLHSPSEYTLETWPKLVAMAGKPLAITMEVIDITQGDPLA